MEFRDFLDSTGLIDLGFSGPRFTWCNNRQGGARVWERLDRAVASAGWLQRFQDTRVQHLPRVASDHCPILISTQSPRRPHPPFRFERFWVSYPRSWDIVREVWSIPVRGQATYRISRHLELLKRRLTLWNRVEVGHLIRRIEAVEADITALQLREDQEEGLSTADLGHLRHSLSQHHQLLSQQETYWRQRSRVQWVEEGDRNTRFFHHSTMLRRAANRIRQVRGPDGSVESEESQIREVFLHYFRARWSPVQVLQASPRIPRPQVSISSQENETLAAPVSDSEIRQAVWDLGQDKAPGPDGFPPLFFRRYWPIISSEVIQAIRYVFLSAIIPPSWNRTFISLIPKRPGASSPEHFRPISLCTTLYKVCAKILVSRLQRVIPRLISPEQVAFIKGRTISDNILLAQEFFFDLRHAPARQSLMALQLDMERAYDCMSWQFLRQTLCDFGFCQQWISWIMACILAPTFSILINGAPTQFFQSLTGLRQGCPLSPYLFILCTDGLSRALTLAVQEASLDPYQPAPGAPLLSHLLFADDCILMGRATVANAETFAGVLQAFCQVSGQRVNSHKSSILFSPRTRPRLRQAIREVLHFEEQDLPISYLGIPISGRRPRLAECRTLLHQIRSRLQGWQAQSLSMMGRLTLIRSVLSSIPIHLLAHTSIPVACLRSLERWFRDFLWHSGTDTHGTHLLSWDILCQPLRAGGLGIQSLLHRRQTLLSRQAARFLLHPHSLWTQVMTARYGQRQLSSSLPAPSATSFMWSDISAQAGLVQSQIRCLIGDGCSTEVLSDAWISPIPLSRWPTFLSMDFDDRLRVQELIDPDTRRWRSDRVYSLFGPALAARVLAIPIPIFPTGDVRIWDRTRASCSVYQHCPSTAPPPSIQIAWIWTVPAHPRVRLFLWKLAWNRLPTRSLLVRRGLSIPIYCPVCGLDDETAEHALLRCSRSRYIWQQFGFSPWESCQGSWIPPFLASIQHGPAIISGSVAYVAYHIWNARNVLVFQETHTSIWRIIHLASVQAHEFRHPCDAMSSLPGLEPWDSLAAAAAHPRVISISWEPPSPGLVKVNFDGSVRGAVAGAGFVIRDSTGQLLAAGGLPVPGATVPEAELAAAWAGLVFATRHLQAERVLLEGDSSTVVAWIRGHFAGAHPPPLLRDIWSLVSPPSTVAVCHIFREANSAADWVAAFVAEHSGPWSWLPSVDLPPPFVHILLFDSLGCSRTRSV